MAHASVNPDLLGLVSRQITPDMVNNLASTLGEDRDRTASALSTSVPSVLAAFGDVARSDAGAAHLEEALGHTPAAAAKVADVGSMLGTGAARSNGAAAAFMEQELGSRSASIADAVARTSGIKRDSAGKLLSGVATLAMAALSKGAGAMGFGTLRRALVDQRAGFVGKLPGPMAALFTNGAARTARADAIATPERRVVAGPAIRELPAPRRRWLLPVVLIVLAALAIPLLRGLRRQRTPLPEVPHVSQTVPAVPRAPEPPKTAEPPAPAPSAPAPAEPPAPEPSAAPAEPPAAAPAEETAQAERGAITRTSDAAALGAFLAEPEGAPPHRFILTPLTFRFGSDQLTPPATATVDDLAAVLQQHPSATIRIEGHTDNVGAPASNQALSANRAETIKRALAARGVDDGRMDTAGLGQDQPIASNDTADGRARNRRTEIVVTGR